MTPEERINQQQFMEIMRQVMPEFHIVAVQMIRSRVNPAILFHVMRHLGEVANGKGYGKVTVNIEEGIARFVVGEHSTKVNESVLIPEIPPEEMLDIR